MRPTCVGVVGGARHLHGGASSTGQVKSRPPRCAGALRRDRTRPGRQAQGVEGPSSSAASAPFVSSNLLGCRHPARVGITTGQPRRTSRRHPRRRESSASDDDVKEHTRNIAGPAAFVNGILALRVFDRHRYDRETMGLGATIARRCGRALARVVGQRRTPPGRAGRGIGNLVDDLATSCPLTPALSREREREASESERVRGLSP